MSLALRNRTPGSRERGLSLVEMMIALLVGLILMAGVLSLFLSNRRSYTLGSAVAHMQENGRFALDFLRPQLRSAGYTGCGSQSIWQTPQVDLLNYNPTDVFDFTVAVVGFDYTNPATNVGGSYTIASETPALDTSASDWSPAIPTNIWSAISGTVIPGSDIIMIHSINPNGISISSFPGGGNSANVKVYNGNLLTNNVVNGTIAFVTNCQEAAVFQVTNANSSSGTVVHSASGKYSPGNVSAGKVGSFALPASLYTAQTYVYFIGKGADNMPALYMSNLSVSSGNVTLSAPLELVPGVVNMQILYGVDTDGDGIANQYVAASAISNWATADVVSVRIALLVSSDNNVVPATALSPIDVAGVAITPPPNTGTTTTRRLYKVFVETVAIRNRLP